MAFSKRNLKSITANNTKKLQLQHNSASNPASSYANYASASSHYDSAAQPTDSADASAGCPNQEKPQADGHIEGDSENECDLFEIEVAVEEESFFKPISTILSGPTSENSRPTTDLPSLPPNDSDKDADTSAETQRFKAEAHTIMKNLSLRSLENSSEAWQGQNKTRHHLVAQMLFY